MPEQLISWLLRGRKRETDAKGMEKKIKRKLGWREQKDI